MSTEHKRFQQRQYDRVYRRNAIVWVFICKVSRSTGRLNIRAVPDRFGVFVCEMRNNHTPTIIAFNVYKLPYCIGVQQVPNVWMVRLLRFTIAFRHPLHFYTLFSSSLRTSSRCSFVFLRISFCKYALETLFVLSHLRWFLVGNRNRNWTELWMRNCATQQHRRKSLCIPNNVCSMYYYVVGFLFWWCFDVCCCCVRLVFHAISYAYPRTIL